MSISASTDHETAAVVEQLKEEVREDFLLEQVLMISMICFGQDVFQTFIYSAFKYHIISYIIYMTFKYLIYIQNIDIYII